MWSRLVALVVVVGLLVSACSSDPPATEGRSASDGVRIAAFDFAESVLIAELYAQALEARGLPVIRLGGVGPREVVAPALELAQIDVVPEYLGTASSHFGADGTDGAALAAALEPRGLVALEPAPAEDVNVFVVTAGLARQHDLRAISDLATIPGEVRFGGTVECPERPLCLLGLEDVYGLTLTFVPQRSLAVTAEALLRDEIDVGLMFSTAAELSEGDFVVLEDDRELQPPENVVPVVRADALERWGPALEDGVTAVSRLLTTESLQALNRAVAEGQPTPDAAAAWLRAAGLDR